MRLALLALGMLSLGCNPTPAATAVPLPAVVPTTHAPEAPAPVEAVASEEARGPQAREAPAESGASEADGCAAKDGDASKKQGLSCADRKAWRAVLAWPEPCEEAYEAGALRGSAGMEFHRIAPQQWIVKVECTLGAYQGYAVYFLRDESASPPKSALLSFRTYEAPSDDKLVAATTTELWGEAEFKDKTKELVVFNRYRGIGDCGALVTYAMDTGKPRIKEFRSKNRCDGKWSEPAKWKKIPPP